MPGPYVIIADFGVVDPDVSAAEEASRSNETTARTEALRRPAIRFRSPGDLVSSLCDGLYRTDR